MTELSKNGSFAGVRLRFEFFEGFGACHSVLHLASGVTTTSARPVDDSTLVCPTAPGVTVNMGWLQGRFTSVLPSVFGVMAPVERLEGAFAPGIVTASFGREVETDGPELEAIAGGADR